MSSSCGIWKRDKCCVGLRFTSWIWQWCSYPICRKNHQKAPTTWPTHHWTRLKEWHPTLVKKGSMGKIMGKFLKNGMTRYIYIYMYIYICINHVYNHLYIIINTFIYDHILGIWWIRNHPSRCHCPTPSFQQLAEWRYVSPRYLEYLFSDSPNTFHLSKKLLHELLNIFFQVCHR